MALILIMSIWLITSSGHDTMISINQVEGTDSLKVTCRMNFNDFLRDLQTIDDDRNLGTIFSKEPYPTDLVNQYFNSKVFIYINKKLLIGKLLTVNRNSDDIIMNLLYRSEKNPKRITIRNIILTGWYSDQSNLVIISIKNLEKGIKLTSRHTEETFTIKD